MQCDHVIVTKLDKNIIRDELQQNIFMKPIHHFIFRVVMRPNAADRMTQSLTSKVQGAEALHLPSWASEDEATSLLRG
jgi:hypothetical protein